MTAQDYIRLNDHLHGEPNRGRFGCYSLPKSGYSIRSGSRRERFDETSATNYEKLQTANKILASFES